MAGPGFRIQSRHSLFSGDSGKDGENMDDALESVIKLTWNVWAVSPLFGLRFDDEVVLKQYAKKLREQAAASLSQERVAYKAQFRTLEDLVHNSEDPPALQVQVHSTKDEDDKVTCIYNGIFLSWGERREAESDNVKLPILLTRGAQNVTRAVHSVLRSIFDCTITAMPASQEDLMWLSTIILSSLDNGDRSSKHNKNNELTLGYKIPGLPATDTIKVKLPLHSVIQLWSKICPPHQSTSNTSEAVANIISLEQVTKFYECIRIQMLDNADLELGYCLLDEISLPSLTIKGTRMKATTIDAMDRVLWFLDEKASLYSPSVIPVINLDEEDEADGGDEAEDEE